MRFIIYGAGAIGGTIGARLHKAGEDVLLVARGEHARVLANEGMRFIHPDGIDTLTIPVVTHPQHIEAAPDDVILLCMKTQHTTAALADLCAANLHDVPVVCVQNGVANEQLALRVCSRVYASVVNLPAMHMQPGVIATYAGKPGGVLDTAGYPGQVDDFAERYCAALRNAGFAADAAADVMAQKYAKLLTNLSNVLELLLAERDDFSLVGRVLRSEAKACYAAGGIDFVPIRDYVERNSKIYQPVDLEAAPRTGGSTYQSLQRGAAEVETDYLNGEIARLGRLHGVAVPANALMQVLAREVIGGKRSPRSMSASDVMAMLPESVADRYR